MQATKKIYNLQSLNFFRYANNLKVGILGGSFNPAHSGHIAISELALKKFNMDYVIWLVANQNPLKDTYNANIIERSETALDMITNPRILVSTAEHDLHTIYIYDSMLALTKQFQHIDFTWLMGIDNIANFDKWYKNTEFVKLCKIVIFDRPVKSRITNYCRFLSKFKPTIANSQTSNIIIHKGKLSDASSTSIRNQSILGDI